MSPSPANSSSNTPRPADGRKPGSFLGHPDSIRHKNPLRVSRLPRSETPTVTILLFTCLLHRGLRRRPGHHFTARQPQLFPRQRTYPFNPPPPTHATNTTTTSLISPCLSLTPNLSPCHFNYSPGNLYGGIPQEHQSAKKVISRPATQLWYQE